MWVIYPWSTVDINHLNLKPVLAATGIPYLISRPLVGVTAYPKQGATVNGRSSAVVPKPVVNTHCALLPLAGYFCAEYRLRIWASDLTTYVWRRPILLPGPLLTMIWVTFEWFPRHPFLFTVQNVNSPPDRYGILTDCTSGSTRGCRYGVYFTV